MILSPRQKTDVTHVMDFLYVFFSNVFVMHCELHSSFHDNKVVLKWYLICTVVKEEQTNILWPECRDSFKVVDKFLARYDVV